MITEKLIDILFAVTSGLFSILPDVSWDVNTSSFEYLRSVLEMVCYLIPLGTVKTLIALIISIAVFRAMVALFWVIRDLLPFI